MRRWSDAGILHKWLYLNEGDKFGRLFDYVLNDGETSERNKGALNGFVVPSLPVGNISLIFHGAGLLACVIGVHSGDNSDRYCHPDHSLFIRRHRYGADIIAAISGISGIRLMVTGLSRPKSVPFVVAHVLGGWLLMYFTTFCIVAALSQTGPK
jgi:hypothetical protein